MLTLADKYRRDVEEVHKAFFEFSCNREKLIKFLEGQKVEKWSILEDLALSEDPNSLSYRHVVQTKGENEASKRKMFLELMK